MSDEWPGNDSASSEWPTSETALPGSLDPSSYPTYNAPSQPPSTPTYGHSTPAPQPLAPSPYASTNLGEMLVSIGDIAVYPSCVVTPSGIMPHRGLTWVVRDNSTTRETMPAYAIILAIVFFLVCLLGLLFLLIKERKTEGYIEVSVQSQYGFHVTQIRATSPQHIDFVRQQVDYARGLAYYG